MASISMSAPGTHKPVHCVGCGSNVTYKSSDRRSLQSANSQVITLWKALLDHVLNQEELQVDLDVDELHSNVLQSGKMCRKCFSAFDRFTTLHNSLIDNMKKAIEIISSTLSSTLGIKRRRLDFSADIPQGSALLLQSETTSTQKG